MALCKDNNIMEFLMFHTLITLLLCSAFIINKSYMCFRLN